MNKSSASDTNIRQLGPLFYLKFLVKIGHNSKNIAFRVMPLVFQLHLVIMSTQFPQNSQANKDYHQPVPKTTMLKFQVEGKCCKVNNNTFLALTIASPFIELDRSSSNIKFTSSDSDASNSG